MKKKTCNHCGIEKELTEFHKYKKSKDGFKSKCKVCRIEETKLYYEKNSEKIKEKSKEYREKNPEKIKEGLKRYREKNPEKIKEMKSIWAKSQSGKESKKRYYLNNREKIIKKVTEHKKNNPEIEIKRRNSENRKTYIKEYGKKYRKKNSHIFAWRSVLRNTLKRVGTKKEKKTNEILGYSAHQLKEHIEKKFVDGMSWENWGEWHIDHIKPVSSFDKSEKISIINSLDNLQPLWAEDNLKKYNKTNK